MKTGQIAKAMGVDSQTVRAWVDNPAVAGYFSKNALGVDVTQRSFSERDYLVLNTIRHFKMHDRLSDWNEIAELIKIRMSSDNLIAEVPQDAFINDPRTITITQAEQSAKAAATLAELRETKMMIENLSNTIDELQKEKEVLRKEKDENTREYMQMIASLNREIGRLEGELKSQKERSNGLALGSGSLQ